MRVRPRSSSRSITEDAMNAYSMALGCAALSLAGCSFEENTATSETVDDAIVTFASTAVAQHSGRCMDVFGAGTGNNVNLIQWNCHGGTNQSFTFTPVSGTTDTET